MRYSPEQIDSLAAEYVIGTLHGQARKRFEGLMQQRADIRLAIWQWERRVAGLASGLQPTKPSRRIWRQVHQRIEPSQPKPLSFLNWLPALAASLAVVVFSTWFFLSTPVSETNERIAVFSEKGADALWVINANLERGSLITQTITPPMSIGDSVYELWVLPVSGNPRSMGLLDRSPGIKTHVLTPDSLAALPQAMSLAISIEPAGGSPTGLPTGPVVYQAPLVWL